MSENGEKIPEGDPAAISFNGINGATGEYLSAPLTVEDLAKAARKFSFGPDPAHSWDLKRKSQSASEANYKVSSEFGDPAELSNAGWAIIFPAGADPRQVDAILKALDELLQIRKGQAAQRFKVYRGADGYRWPDGKPETTSAFLARHGATLGPVDPNFVPAYLLLVADPQSIPYQFQYELDVDYFVGRIYFQTLDEYARYAHSVALAEKGQVCLPRTAAFFGVANPGDQATRLSSEYLVKPLANFVKQKSMGSGNGWKSELIEPRDARRATLSSLLGGEQTPALLFTASHGLGWTAPNPEQYRRQGGLVCQDWEGPSEKVGPGHVLTAQDLPKNNSPLGMIAFLFACYGAGTPYWDAFAASTNQARTSITTRPFLAALPTHLLGHPNGGALAVVGHVERAYTYSFRWGKLESQTSSFRSLLAQLLDDKPIGLALDDLNLRYASLATALKEMLEEAKYSAVDPYELAFHWTATNDARGYTLLGDPAVRLAARPADSPEPPRLAFELTSPPGGLLPLILAPEALAALTPAEQQLVAQENTLPQTQAETGELSAPPAPAPAASPPAAQEPQAGPPPPRSQPVLGGEAAALAPAVQPYASPFDGLAGAVRSYSPDEAFGVADDLKKMIGPLVENLNQALKNVAEELKEATTRVATLEVSTSLVEDLDHFNVLKPDPAQVDLRFKTTVSLTGDINLYLSAQHQDVDETLVELHRRMVELAQVNRLETIKTLGEMIASLFSTKP